MMSEAVKTYSKLFRF